MEKNLKKPKIWEQDKGDVGVFTESIVETIREPLVILDQDLNIELANPAFYRKFRVNRAETEGRRIYELGNGQWDIPGLRELLEIIIPENETIEDFEVEHDFPDLGHRIMHLNARRIEQEGGRNFILLAIEDVTERIEARRALEESEALYNRLVEEINSIIIEISPDGAISFFNRFAENVFGYSRNELIGKQLVGTILPETDSEGHDNSGLIAGLFQNPDQYYLNESIGVHKDGREIWFSWSARFIREPVSGKEAILIDGNDMTYVRQVKKQARVALEMIQASRIPMVLLDPRKTCLIANEAFGELAGKHVEEVENSQLMETGLPEDLIDRLNGAIDNALQTGRENVFETDYGRKSLLIRVEPEYEKTDGIGGTSIFFHDITARKRAEQELQNLNQVLEQRVDERTRLAEGRARQLHKLATELIEAEERERQRIAQILHDDLQQLLAAARMQLNAAIDYQNDPAILQKVEHLLGQSIKKSRSLSHELTPPVLHQSDLIASIGWLTDQMEEQFGLTVQVENKSTQLFENGPLKVFLFRTVQELLFNVAKHAGVNSALVTLYDDPDNSGIVISDQGHGFDPDELVSAENIGLGLMRVQERARSMGGSFTVDSAPGRGSRFTLTIPRSAEVFEETPSLPAHAATVPPSEPVKEKAYPCGKGIRVLFADDHRVIRQGLIALIQGHPDIQVVGEAQNGREAVELSRKLTPDVVLMDVSMPEMDGVEATRKIKAALPRVRIIGLSMHDDEQIAKTMRQAGAESFKTKTASSSELLQAIYGMDEKI